MNTHKHAPPCPQVLLPMSAVEKTLHDVAYDDDSKREICNYFV